MTPDFNHDRIAGLFTATGFANFRQDGALYQADHDEDVTLRLSVTITPTNRAVITISRFGDDPAKDFNSETYAENLESAYRFIEASLKN